MARKPATKPDDQKAGNATANKADEAKTAPADAQDTNTKGGDKAAQAGGAPETAPQPQPQGQIGGEGGTDLPANFAGDLAASVAPDDASLPAPVVDEEADVLPDAAWMVVCHRDGGRRRAGRHWSEGQTPVQVDELSEYDLAQLRGDPQFTVFAIERD